MRFLLFVALAWLAYRFVVRVQAQKRLAAPAADVDDPRAVLGVSGTASADEVRSAYRALAKRHHPDRAPPEERPAAEIRMRRIQAAYDKLARR